VRNNPAISKKASGVSLNIGSGNALLDTISSFGSPLQSISVLAFVVLIHEAGHFLAARSFDIKVEEFSVGVGPKLLGFTPSKGRNEGIEFNLRALPLGGYVRFPENYNQTLVQEMEEKVYEAEKKAKKKEKEQTLVSKNKEPEKIIQSPTLALLGKLFQYNKVNAEAKLKQVEKPKPKVSPLAKLFSINALQKKEEQIEVTKVEHIQIDYYDDPDLLQNRNWIQRAVVLSAGVVFNLLLAFSLYFVEATVGNGIPTPTFESGCVVSAAARPGGASYGLLYQGDVIVGINGERLFLSKKTSPLESQGLVSEVITKIRSTSPGEQVFLDVQPRGNREAMKKVVITPKPLSYTDANSPPSIGVMLSPNLLRVENLKAKSLPDAAALASSAVYDLTTDTARSIYGAIGMLGKMIVGGGSSVGGSLQLSGPIGVIKMGSEVVRTNDLTAVAMFAAAISVNLAVVNSLPIPALDGGQLVFVLGEAVTGRKLDQRKQEEINALALLVLLLVTFSTTVGDLSK